MAYKRNKKFKHNNNRLNLVMAVIFLLTGAILFRLYNLQILKHDLYTALASDQHQVYNRLKPARGQIFIQDSAALSGGKLYPVATNKDFALVFAVPRDVIDARSTAERLYEIFDQDEVAADVNRMLEEDDFFASTSPVNETISEKDIKNKEKFKTIKRELEIELRGDAIIEKYFNKLSKKNDPYEPIKYKVLKEMIDPLMDELSANGINYVLESRRYYPEGNIGSHVLGFVGYQGDDRIGQYGLEGFFNEELTGSAGSIKTERSAGGGLIIINERVFNKPTNGSDLVLTINRSIQFTACKKLAESALRHGADGGSLIVMEPNTGAVLAMCSWPDFDPNNYSGVENINVYNNPAIFNQYEPGSIFKVFTMAAGIDQGKVKTDTTYNDKGYVNIEGWRKPIKNSDFDTKGGHGVVDMVTVLEESLNTGSIFVMKKIGAETFADYVKKFGFGEKTGIELKGEAGGDIRNLLRQTIRPVEAATAAFGQGITVTPLQMVTAYSAVANGGILMKPFLVSEIITPGGERIKTQPREIRRVISERTALLVSGMMVNVVESGHAKHAGVKGYFVGGKTGTAQVANKKKRGYSEKTIHTFVGFAPADDPKFVMLIKLDDPKDVRFSASSAAPLFGEIAGAILNYYQVPKVR